MEFGAIKSLLMSSNGLFILFCSGSNANAGGAILIHITRPYSNSDSTEFKYKRLSQISTVIRV